MSAPRMQAWAYKALVLLSSFLLFEIELIAAKLLLPRFGSSASVWTTSLVFFQGALLLGYQLAATATQRFSHRWTQVALVAIPALALPLHLPAVHLPPMAAVSVSLAIAVGLPYVALSTTSIVAQRWLSQSGLPGAHDPAFLYGTSNAGALLALLTYPTVVEPALDLRAQLGLWYAGYGAFVLLTVACVPPRAPPSATALPPRHGRMRLEWLILGAAPNALLMAVTSAVTADASVPLLWILPLTIYLATLIAAFAPRPASPRTVSMAAVASLAVAAAGLLLIRGRAHFELGAVLFHDGLLGASCLLANVALARLRPSEPQRLGGYFLALSAGGFAGSLLVGVAMPALGVPFEYADYLVAGGLLVVGLLVRDRERLASWGRGKASRRAGLAGAGLGALGLVGLLGWAGAARNLDASRTFYGFYRVYDEGDLRYFRHGETVHGLESLAGGKAGEPLAYYHRGSPIGRLLALDLRRDTVGVVGLGVGSLAAYARPGERWDFFELDPEVERLARKDFSFLSRCRGRVRVITGDARQSLGDVPDGRYDLLVLDAFAADFVPLHLVDREALALYRRKLAPGGLMVFHVSSRVFDLVPVLARLADDARLRGAYAQGAAGAEGEFASLWLALGDGEEKIAPLVSQLGWQPLTLTPELRHRRVWTDGYVNLFHALRR